MKVSSANSIIGAISLPGDKSISHRAAMFASIAEGETTITNFGSSVDCASTLACFEQLGVGIERAGSTVRVKGVGKYGLKRSAEPLDCGNSGTTVRLISGILAGQDFETTLTGDASLSKRPMKRVIEPLTQMGASFDSADNRLPLTIRGKRPLKAIDYKMPVASAQVKSCVLLAGLYAAGTTSVAERDFIDSANCVDSGIKSEIPNRKSQIALTRDHTERMLRWFGADVVCGPDGRVSISGDAKLSARDFRVPSDVSSAAFFLVAASCLPGSGLLIENVGLNPTRTAVIDVLQRFGANIERFGESELSGEPVGNLRVCGANHLKGDTRSNLIDGDIIANIIDEIPILAVFGTQVESGIEIRGARELRVKESDRIASVVENLRRMNANVEEFEDGFRIAKSKLRGARIDSFDDHRIAMAFAVAGLFADGETEIDGADCAAVSFPEFFETLRSVCG
ncbi:MAG: 3-phosphoshikimate 1-carboxyvinyltransferase [Acidobacteria bacterium]|nr:3-phosphoshikimate 1-carboxyvinyltransferase [Acidobacteriota bacterium]